MAIFRDFAAVAAKLECSASSEVVKK